MNQTAAQLLEKIENRSARVGVVGMGYVGLPLALLFAKAGFDVVGLDIDPAKTDALNRGQSYISHIPSEEIARLFADGTAQATTDFSDAAGLDAILICVPTPLSGDREPDLGFVRSTVNSLLPHLGSGQLLVLESTTYPGTSREVVRPCLERGGLAVGKDVFLAYSPEREDPGNPEFSTANIPKVVGADDDEAMRLASALYGRIVPSIIPVSSMDVAEAVKLTENIFRSVNIALVNELKTVYAAMGIDIWEVIEAAKTKPFGYMPFYPGPGLGGHCIPIDPFYLSWRAKQFGEETRFVELAGEINTAMPAKVAEKLQQALADQFGKPLGDSRILIVGMAYKKNVDDTRESPGLELMELLLGSGAAVDFFDPYVAEIPKTREHPDLAGIKSMEWTAARLPAYDAAVICTDHDDVPYGELAASGTLIVDTRNATRGLGAQAANIVKA